MRKQIIALMTVGLILTSAIPALAETSTTSPTSSASSSKLSPQEKADQNTARLQKEILRIQNTQKMQQALGPIRDLQKQEADLRSQIKTVRDQIHQQIKTNRQAKNYDVIVTALNGLIAAQSDISALETLAQTCQADWQQLKSDKQANNEQAISTDLQKIQADIQNRISAMQKVLSDLQNISQGLNTPASSTPQTAQKTTVQQ